MRRPVSGGQPLIVPGNVAQAVNAQAVNAQAVVAQAAAAPGSVGQVAIDHGQLAVASPNGAAPPDDAKGAAAPDRRAPSPMGRFLKALTGN